MDWRWQTMAQLSQAELYAILAARQEVFVVEQKISYIDADGKDFGSYHLSGWLNDELAAYLRVIILPDPGALKIGRVLTRPFFRGQGHGEALMQELLRVVARDYSPSFVSMSAQVHLEKFYQKFGFQSSGGIFYEENIPHIAMSRNFFQA